MSSVDLSEAIFSGATLAGVQMVLRPGAPTSRALTDGAVMTGSEIAGQLLSSGPTGPLGIFMYQQHRNLTTATFYALIQEVLRMFGKESFSISRWRAIFGNIFLALGSVSVGSNINSALGMAPGSISIADVAQIAGSPGSSIPNSYDNGGDINNRGPPPKARAVYNV